MREHGAQAASALTQHGDNPAELMLPPDMTEDDFLAYGERIGHAMAFAAWRVGDFCNFGFANFKYKDYSVLAKVTGLDEVYLRTCASVAARVEPALRNRVSLERARLMLQRLNSRESAQHCFQRLANKTTRELRDLAKTGSPGKKKKAKARTEITADGYYAAVMRLVEMTETFPKEKWALLAVLEISGATGRMMEQLILNMRALLDAITNRA
jgi:hypothetical protein